MARALFRVGEHRGEHTRLDWADSDTPLLPTSMSRPSEEINQAFECFAWRVSRGGKYKQNSHINLQEIRALRGEIRRRGVVGIRGGKVPAPGQRVVVGVDSRVCVGAYAKVVSLPVQFNGILNTCMGIRLV